MRTLTVGERVPDVTVHAGKPWNGTGILVHSGERYRIDASGETWSDASLESTAAGQPGSGIQRIFKAFIRCRQAQWFELVATVGRSDRRMFPVGLGAEISVPSGESGELGFFANDVIFMYWNNSGEIRVTITREA